VKLTDIDPATLAAELVERAHGHHVTRLVVDLDPTIEVKPGGMRGWQGTNLGLAAFVLAHYARTGEGPGDAPIVEYLQSYCEALYTRPADAGHYDVPPLDQVDGEPTEAHEVVLVAAVARDLIAQGSPVSLLHLSVLTTASERPISYAHVRRLASSGEIETNGARGAGAHGIDASEARRWLAARGVPGV
jgi:hypothetical protein